MDDVRHRSNSLRFGTRWNTEERKWTCTEADKKEDKRMKYEMLETTNKRMARLCLPAINSVNEDLVFTAEIPEDFEDKKLPTLDFYLWLEKNGYLNHSYFQKLMKTPLVIMQHSAMSDKQRYAILSNELNRRLSNTNIELVDHDEQTKIIEKFIQQLKSSGYERKSSREIIVSGILGWKRKIERRKREGTKFYRSAKTTLASRCRRKLTAKSTWFKRKRGEEDDEEKTPHHTQSPKKRQRTDKNDKKVVPKNSTKNETVKAVMFVPYTEGSELARRMREAESNLEALTGYRIKIVERSGLKLEDTLCKADPWQGQDCGRDKCLLCLTKTRTGQLLSQDCSRRSVVYESWCMSCKEKDMEEAKEKAGGDMKKEKELQDKVQIYKYVGETARSLYERSFEHLSDYENLSTKSHMLKHVVDKHEGEDRSQIKFGIKVIKYSKSSYERQIQ